MNVNPPHTHTHRCSGGGSGQAQAAPVGDRHHAHQQAPAGVCVGGEGREVGGEWCVLGGVCVGRGRWGACCWVRVGLGSLVCGFVGLCEQMWVHDLPGAPAPTAPCAPCIHSVQPWTQPCTSNRLSAMQLNTTPANPSHLNRPNTNPTAVTPTTPTTPTATSPTDGGPGAVVPGPHAMGGDQLHVRGQRG